MSRFPTHFRFLLLSTALLLGSGLIADRLQAEPAENSQTAQPGSQPTTVVEDIVARVNDQIITQSDYQRAAQQLEAESKEQAMPEQQIEQRKRDLLRDLIDQQLLLSRGKELNITGENELVRRLDEIRKQNHLNSMEDLEKAAEAQGVSYEDFKANIRNSIITQQVVENEVSRHLTISPTEVETYYQAHQADFAQPESIHLSEILVPTPAGASSADVAAAQAKAGQIEEKLKAGADFADLARSVSGGPTASAGGDLGEFRRGMLAPVFEQKTFGLMAGQFTAPIQTKQGFVILEVTQHTAPGDSFKDAEPQVEQAVFMQHMQPALRAYLTKLREAAYIDIKPGYTDSGASPNEIQLTYSAYQPPGPKKKKKFTRTRYRGRTPSATPLTQAAKSSSAAPGAAPSAAPTAVASTRQPVTAGNEQPGKKEKIRFGQAPREALPVSQAAAANAPQAASGPQESANLTGAPSAPPAPQPAPAQAPDDSKKTRFNQRAVVHKVKAPKQAKQQKAAAVDQYQPPAAPPDELANQKVQDAPLGLADQTPKKKKKVKGPKTRFASTPPPPEVVQQPYMGSQQPGAATPSNGSANGAANGAANGNSNGAANGAGPQSGSNPPAPANSSGNPQPGNPQ